MILSTTGKMCLTILWDLVSSGYTMRLNFNNSGGNLEASIKAVLDLILMRRNLAW